MPEQNGPVKHIGIVAVSAEGAALCYRTICLEGAAVLGPHDHPEITLHGFSLRNYQRLIDEDRWDAVGEMMLESAAHIVRSEDTEMPGWKGYAASFDDFALERDDSLPQRYRGY